MMGAGHVAPRVGKVEVLRNQEATFVLCGVPHGPIAMARKVFLIDGIDIVTQAGKSSSEKPG